MLSDGLKFEKSSPRKLAAEQSGKVNSAIEYKLSSVSFRPSLGKINPLPGKCIVVGDFEIDNKKLKEKRMVQGFDVKNMKPTRE